MESTILIDQLFITVRVPAELPETEVDLIRRTLPELEFMRHLEQAIQAAFRAFPELSMVRVSLAR
jgi:hypothetical protein